MADHASASSTAQKQKCPEDEKTTSAGMCINDCGFFGAAATGGMCSRCYREHVAFAADNNHAAAASVVVAPAASIASPEKKAQTGVVSDGAGDTSAKQPMAATNRCATCRKKVGLTGFRCRCEGTFCSVHRYSDKHECGFDYKAAGREQIAKHNPVVVADKIARI